MGHHSDEHPLNELPPEMRGRLNEGFRKMERSAADEARIRSMLKSQLEQEIGPTGDHPDGKLGPHDEGGLVFGVTVFQGRVVLDFGKPVRSVGFTQDDAIKLAETLKERAKECLPILRGSVASE